MGGMRSLLPSLPPDPVASLLERDLPQGNPWDWLGAQLVLEAAPLARRALQPGGLAPGWQSLAQSALAALALEIDEWQQRIPIGDLGFRSASVAEQTALEVLRWGEGAQLEALYRNHGYGAYTRCSAFLFDGQLQPVSQPDPVEFSELVGFHRQVALLQRNAERFLEGHRGVPTLLYGARGSGKSSAVKALRSRYHGRGLRLIEVLSAGLDRLPVLLDELQWLPYRFVLYLDDLSMRVEDPGFHRLKALLEGAVYGKPANVWVVATSNRRNLVSESWNDRPQPGEEPAAWDTLQDKLALADRFGLVLTFPPFDQPLYLEAVTHLLGRPLDDAENQQALRFALEGRGFSGRSARQFVDWIA